MMCPSGSRGIRGGCHYVAIGLSNSCFYPFRRCKLRGLCGSAMTLHTQVLGGARRTLTDEPRSPRPCLVPERITSTTLSISRGYL
ncbi:hypothetical protein PsYK624_078190 [Phanerochaete sordida]|uniref:Uncharacterized protein n=1 Tax=Phanerochaete sordida TaxID=48140 RepID=A0A9P3GD80_9APHY|nr:hypothetical protein PsYK624_078190 [Phanerochaete sordida]